ncbi:squalene/phytoene synthase family protein [Phototrophicus methaneseepsis]|uniref:Squalene/phytoene synthase family protein n=1 Tax=Phototrophicus methaneseepsis TaxID=2710758 RepID=A0A7S8E6L7_9CHLR|nr:squalene/phytoene synthase family protein [Phototrophicus methaneseepsis]QPC81290.1 squalene/phytoene synthase family protein [Phototrophicus methaneseepsis]
MLKLSLVGPLIMVQPKQDPYLRNYPQEPGDIAALPMAITRAASKQTYYTIRFLVDRDRVLDAYRAYAYFRWVDDTLDQSDMSLAERLAFVDRQQQLLACAMERVWPFDLMPEEQLLADLLHSRPGQEEGLQAYLQNMMAVMAFDANRRRQIITEKELADYSQWLSVAVTEALHYFIGHDRYSPQGQARYLAVIGAHITHMLRDTLEDAEAGYFNISSEFISATGLDPMDVASEHYREWAEQRVQQARACFRAGKDYLAQVKSARCRMAGYAYTVRFEQVLNAIERDHFRLRRDYPERKSLYAATRMMSAALLGSLRA